MEAQMLRDRQKQVDSTSADSDEQDSLFDSSDDAGSQDELINAVSFDPGSLSLILKDDPANSKTLLLYLKHYSELLFNWGETKLAVEACKLISDAC